MEAVEAGGEWWLPESPGHRVPGVLRMSSAGAAQLVLLGHLRERIHDSDRAANPDGTVTYVVTPGSLQRSGRYARVLGETDSRIYTLTAGHRTRRSGLGSNVASETIRFDQVLAGAALDTHQELSFDRVTVDLQWLAHWVGTGGIDEEVTSSAKGGSITVRGTALPTRRVRLGNGLTIYLRHSLGLEGPVETRRSVTQRFAFETRSTTALPLPALMQVPARIQALISIGTGRVAGFEQVILSSPTHRHGPPSSPTKYRLPIESIAEWTARDPHSEPPHEHEMPFTLPILGDMPAMGRWLAVAKKYDHQLDAVMATKYRNGLVSDRLLNRVAAIEGYHKLRSPQKHLSLRQRLTDCAAIAGHPFAELVGDVPNWVTMAVRERNNVGHGSPSSNFEATHTLFAADAAYWMFVLCLLRDASAPDVVFDRISSSPDFRWLRQKLDEDMP